jgi:hypothetical protein
MKIKWPLTRLVFPFNVTSQRSTKSGNTSHGREDHAGKSEMRVEIQGYASMADLRQDRLLQVDLSQVNLIALSGCQ